jgi:hypothetical protein
MKVKLVLLIIALGLLCAPGFAQERNNGDEVLAELQHALNWDGATTQKVGVALDSFKQNMAEAMGKYQDEEEPDVQAMIHDFKKVRGDYQKDLEGILGRDGLNAYNNYVEQVLIGMFADIATIRLLDLKNDLELTDEQIDKLAPPMGESFLEMFRTVLKYGDRRMTVRTKLKFAVAVKGIQSDIQGHMEEVLTEEQLAKLEQMKEA